MVKRFTGSGRNKESGYLATHKQDFDAHETGGDFRHGALDMDMEPAVSTLMNGAFNSTTVQGTIEKICDVVNDIGQGFITIGDGYDTGQPPNYRVETEGSLKNAFVAAFTHPRLVRGGVILLKAGTYILTDTIEVPPGITIMGEARGTVIVGNTSEKSLFKILKAQEFMNIGTTSSATPSNNPTNGTKLYNLLLCDNVNNTGTAPGFATMQTVPMISVESGASFSCEQVTFLGKYDSGSAFPAQVTQAAIGTIVGASTPTYLNVNNCYIDGCGVGIEFSPSGAAINNNLIVSGCRARLFGRTSTALANNCFVSFSPTNGSFTNNYVKFNQLLNTSLFVKTNGTVTSPFPKISIVGNTGGTTYKASPATTQTNLLSDTTGVTNIEYAIVGNSVAERPQNEWCITVGGGTGSTLMGDINGVDAVNFVLQYMQNVESTVYVNAGEYNVTLATVPASFIYGKLKFVGLKIGDLYPTFKINFGASNTALYYGLKTLVLANEIKSIHFYSYGTKYSCVLLNSSYTSYGGIVKIEDCLFTDVLLMAGDVDPSYIDPVTGNVVSTSIIVKDCHFLQTSNFLPSADHLSMVLPQAGLVLVDGCTFKGRGYVGGIGDLNNEFSDNPSKIILKDCVMDITSNIIRYSSPATDKDINVFLNNYFIVNAPSAALTMENCSITANNTFNTASATIHANLDYFDAFIKLNSDIVNINNCVFNGPAQTWTTWTGSPIVYALPTLKIYSGSSLSIDNSKFLGGALPLQIIGPSSFQDLDKSRGPFYNITNSIFRGDIDGHSLCLLDFDADTYDEHYIKKYKPYFNINNCEFTSSNLTSSYRVQHENNVNLSYYKTLSCVMLYANNWNVSLSNSIIDSRSIKITTNGVYSGYCAFYVNTCDLPSVIDLAESEILLNNNSITLHCPILSAGGLDTNSSSNYAFSAYCKGIFININNNVIKMENSAATYSAYSSSNYAGHLFISNQETTVSLNNASTIISNNIFSKKDTSICKQAEILIDSSSSATSRGMVVDNIFTSPYLNDADGETETHNIDLISNTSPSTNWTIERNKNQTVTTYANAFSGMHVVGGDATKFIQDGAVLNVILGALVAASHINVGYDLTTTNTLADTIILYNGTVALASTLEFYNYQLNLSNILPKNVKIIDIEISASSDTAGPDALPYTAGDDYIGMQAGVGSTSDNYTLYPGPNPIQFTTAATKTISITDTHILNNENQLTLRLAVYISNTADVAITLNPITITYRW